MAERRYWNMEMEPILGSERMREIQLDRLQKRAVQLFEHAGYFRRRMRERGVEPQDIKSLEDWARALPPFTKADYRSLMDECGNDVYRLLEEILPVPLNDLVCMAATSGTTGDPQPYPLTSEDADLWGEFILRARWRCGVRPGDRLIHAFALSMFLAVALVASQWKTFMAALDATPRPLPRLQRLLKEPGFFDARVNRQIRPPV